jgi:uncharacterized heparinase superfamily protein
MTRTSSETQSIESRLGESDDSSTSRKAFFANPSNWSLLYHTAKNMQLRQIAGVAERKGRHAVVPRLPIDFDRRYENQVPDGLSISPEPIVRDTEILRSSLHPSTREDHRIRATSATEGSVTFLNRTVDLGDGSEIDWDHPQIEEYPLLWRLKLQAFEPLEWLVLGFDSYSEAPEIASTFENWILSWAEDNPIGERRYLRRSWIPHSVSLRLIHWCRYVAWLQGEDGASVNHELLQQIYKNALFLENHVEWEVGGNHLIENAAGLVLAGILFRNHDQNWIDQGMEILDTASQTQFLEDGGHFERSPMYHIQCLRRFTTCLSLCDAVDAGPVETIQETTQLAGGFLDEIAPPDREIPLLNDSVFGEGLSLEESLRYVQSATSIEIPANTDCTRSGYYWIGEGSTRLLMDAGSVGPPHLPAHSHNDLLSILLWVDGDKILTDTGTFGYAPTRRRRYARGVSAHNTVQVDHTEPIDVGGRYLMGRRVKPSVKFDPGSEPYIEASYTKGSIPKSTYQHTRTVQTGPDWWLVWDEVNGADAQSRTSRLHFHPDYEVDRDSDEQRLDVSPVTGGDLTLSIWPFQIAEASISTSPYFPEFGVEKSRPAVEFMARDQDTFGYLISTSQYPKPELSLVDRHPSTITLDRRFDLHRPDHLRDKTGNVGMNSNQ